LISAATICAPAAGPQASRPEIPCRRNAGGPSGRWDATTLVQRTSHGFGRSRPGPCLKLPVRCPRIDQVCIGVEVSHEPRIDSPAGAAAAGLTRPHTSRSVDEENRPSSPCPNSRRHRAVASKGAGRRAQPPHGPLSRGARGPQTQRSLAATRRTYRATAKAATGREEASPKVGLSAHLPFSTTGKAACFMRRRADEPATKHGFAGLYRLSLRTVRSCRSRAPQLS